MHAVLVKICDDQDSFRVYRPHVGFNSRGDSRCRSGTASLSTVQLQHADLNTE